MSPAATTFAKRAKRSSTRASKRKKRQKRAQRPTSMNAKPKVSSTQSETTRAPEGSSRQPCSADGSCSLFSSARSRRGKSEVVATLSEWLDGHARACGTCPHDRR